MYFRHFDPHLIITVVIILLIELEYNSKCYKETKRMVFSSSVLISIVFIPSLQQWLLFLPVLNLFYQFISMNTGILLLSLDNGLNSCNQYIQ